MPHPPLTPHPGLPAFDYVRPVSLPEACRFLAEHAGEARPLMGGTDLFVRLRDGVWHAKFLVDVKGLDGTNDFLYDARRGLTIGAGVNMNRVIASPEVQACYPVLAQACRTVASYQLRTRATIVGNLCNASPAGDTLGACLALEGALAVHGVEGSRMVSLATFFLGPGETVLQPGEIVTSIHFPLPPPGAQGVYLKLGRNTWSDLSIAGVTAYGFPDPPAASGFQFRVILASVAPVPLPVPAVTEYLAEHPITPEAIEQAARLAAGACRPIDDVRSSARYRKEMVRNLAEKALKQIWERLER